MSLSLGVAGLWGAGQLMAAKGLVTPMSYLDWAKTGGTAFHMGIEIGQSASSFPALAGLGTPPAASSPGADIVPLALDGGTHPPLPLGALQKLAPTQLPLLT